MYLILHKNWRDTPSLRRHSKKNCSSVLMEFGKSNIWLAQIGPNFFQGFRKDNNRTVG